MAIQSSAIESSMMDGLDAGAVAVDDQEDLFDILTQSLFNPESDLPEVDRFLSQIPGSPVVLWYTALLTRSNPFPRYI